jgi:2-iminobutanoate/2-iminopropanoate deaminase
VLENVRAIVEAAGGTLGDVIKTTVYLTDIAHHGAMNEVYALFFVSEFPARTTVQVAGLAPALEGDGHPFLVEIDAVAILGGGA